MTNNFSKPTSKLRIICLALFVPALLVTVSLLSQPHTTVFADLATPSDQLVVTPLPSPSEPSTTPSASLEPDPTETPDVTPSASLSPTPSSEPSTTPTGTLTPTEIPDTDAESSMQSATAELQGMEAPSRLPKQDPGSTPTFQPDYVPGEVLVQYKSSFNPDSLIGKIQVQMLTSSADVEAAEQVASNNLVLYTIQSEKTVEETVAELEQSSAVEFAQPNYIYRTQNIGTNDTYANDMWALKNVGQTVNGTAGVIDADIDGSEAWALSTGSNVIVAVIDTGVYYTHPDLQANMWDGSACKSDTNTTLGGCVHGYDYMDNDKTPLPTTSDHGTHVAGTIAAVKNNGIGVAGVAPTAKIMAIKTDLTSASNIKSVNFARYNGAKIINASWGGYGYDAALKTAIDNYPGLFVTSAGNDAINTDLTPMYPCSFSSSNVICVAASDQSDGLASFSNYGSTHVDIAAPGFNIMSAQFGSSGYTAIGSNFQNLSTGEIPFQWSADGAWGAFSFPSGEVVLYTDYLHIPYWNNVNSTITSSMGSLEDARSVDLEFFLQCDTDYGSPYTGNDYLALELSPDGSSFTEVKRWNEWSIDTDGSSTGSASTTVSYDLPTYYFTNPFRFRFRWVTNSVTHSPTADGCFVDDLLLTKITSQFPDYWIKNGTSMAAPHVAGAAALVYNIDGTLSASQVKNILISSGEIKSAFSSKTVSGKRLNVLNAAQQADGLLRPVYRFWSDQNQSHFYTAYEDEKNLIIATYPERVWKYEGIAYQAYGSAKLGTTPVHRFWSDQNQSHFYTAFEDEKNLIIATYPENIWRYEGVAFYVYPSGASASSDPIYRFWSDQNQSHFYTAFEDEKNLIIATYPEHVWRYEGIAFKAPF